MQNINRPEEERQLMVAAAALRNCFHLNTELPVTRQELKQLIDNIMQQPAFIQLVGTLKNHGELA
jgi:hypothetical protein